MIEPLGRLKTCECQMRHKRPGLGRDAQRFEPALDFGRELHEIRRGFHPAPGHSRAPFVREKSQTAKAHLDRLGQTNRRERGIDRIEHRPVPVADKLKSDVHALRPNPTRAAALRAQSLNQLAERAPRPFGKIESDEQAHDAQLRPQEAVRKYRRTASRAACVACWRIRSRSPPGKRNAHSRGPRSSAKPTWTKPTGFSGVPPPGPAIPVIPTPSVAPARFRMPSARARAASGLTAPFDSINSGGTPARVVFKSLL